MTPRLRTTALGAFALCAALSAHAQSSVTLFGVIDNAVGVYETKSALRMANPWTPPAFGVPGTLTQRATKLVHSGLTTSRLGFRGQEDLGGGWAASFWLEAPVGSDDGSLGVGTFSRRSTISLSGPFGELRAGRDYTPTFWNDGTFDPFSVVGVGTNLILMVGTNLAAGHGRTGNSLAGADNYIRASNSLTYYLPPKLGGVYGSVQYSFHENTKQDWNPNSPSKAGRTYGGRLGYASGPLDVAVSYGEDNKDGTAGAPKDRIRVMNLGASYDFGVAKLFGEVSQIRDKTSTDTPPALAWERERTGKYTGALVGVTVPVGAGLIRASYARVKYNAPDGMSLADPASWWRDDDARTDKLALGYVHNLSKRTALYATVARVKMTWNGAVNPAMAVNTGGGVGFATAVQGVAAGYAPRSATGYEFGLRHSF